MYKNVLQCYLFIFILENFNKTEKYKEESRNDELSAAWFICLLINKLIYLLHLTYNLNFPVPLNIL